MSFGIKAKGGEHPNFDIIKGRYIDFPCVCHMFWGIEFDHEKKKQLFSVKPWNYAWGDIVPIDNAHEINTLQGINISHLGKRKIIFKMPFLGDMLVPWRVPSRRGRCQCSTTMDGFATLPGSNAWTHWDTTTAAGRVYREICAKFAESIHQRPQYVWIRC